MNVLIDVDGLCYIAGAIGEVRHYECVFEDENGDTFPVWVNTAAEVKEIEATSGSILVSRDLVITPGPLSFSLQVAKTKMQTMKHRYGDRLEVYIKGDGTNWRDQVATLHGYKANRTAPKPYHFESIREYLIDVWGAVEIHGKEVDDHVATRAYESSQKYVICSPDKDLDQIPGLHWNYRSNEEYRVSSDWARMFFWKQVLSGDNSDNIKGCWKVGDGKADAMVEAWWGEDDETLWANIVQVYEESMGIDGCPYAGMDPADVALENARLVWMQTEEGVLWTPPGEPKEYIEETGEWQ